ncbi:MAG: radical SAM protein [Gammaproteobacteria bacterium]|nr:radical SAM protein [Gammaproteobacteria bacterium]
MNQQIRIVKFTNPRTTADGTPRARVPLQRLQTLWVNTGTLCNLACEHCYIESTPKNDRLEYITREELGAYLDEIATLQLGTSEIGFTGGEPFMNPDIIPMLEDCLNGGHQVLVLSNAMRPMMKCATGLLRLNAEHPEALTIRVSVDHFEPRLHEAERGPRSWAPTISGLRWLSDSGLRIHVAGRRLWGESEGQLRDGFHQLFQTEGINVDAFDPRVLVLFPEMDAAADVAEISSECWDILGVRPEDQMCASTRMVVKHKGAAEPTVVACTLIPFEPDFTFGTRLADSLGEVSLNHPHCARFCVLGGGSCSG